MGKTKKPLVLEIRIGKKDFPDAFAELWDELAKRMLVFPKLDQVRLGHVTIANALGHQSLAEFTVYFAKAVVHEAAVEGMQKHVGDIVDSMLEIITNRPAKDMTVFGRFCAMMNKVHDEFGHGSLRFTKQSLRDACYFAWQKAQ